MANTSKQMSKLDSEQTLKSAFNEVDKSFTTNGFLVGKIGHKVELVISTTNIANDTETYTFSDSGTQLYQFRVIYTSGSRETMLSAERIS